ncbi:MAG: hypothetical protein HRU82_12940 [Nitrospira sp.]|nr:MAG: hypothetical protein HRU82_12940 [Nitrospira sp.]
MSKFTPKEIQQHVRDEARRKTPVDENKVKEAQALDRAHMEWLMNATWTEVQERLSAIGHLPGTPVSAQMRMLWNDFHRTLQKKRKKTQANP